MDDQPYARPLYERVSVLETEVRHLTGIASQQAVIIRKLDERIDRQEVLAARLLGALAIITFVGQLIAPVILRAAGVAE